ncbi:sigma 54-interacting transcriptional regulator [Janthinobacterium sp. HH01]|uniref:sigma 54-interacting transcriptional regulator n=1 Tax=Janthinobacterium sp. HH01 TaxID=1198452 RepID=UPI00034B6A6C|nr:sigma 54-interacting transcriptional regulator [Janthinobacterium sp. HH01]
MTSIGGATAPLLGLTILWHPDSARIGQQWIGLDRPGIVALSRYAPAFRALHGEGLPLGERSIARAPVQLRRDRDDGVEILLPDSRMVLQLNGRSLAADAYLRREQIDAGAVLGLGGNVLLCLHWVRMLPKASTIRGVLGVGSAAVRLRSLIAQAAPTELPVLLLGETGTGKEVAAQAIHAASQRAGAAMVSVNMATLNEALAAADLFGAVKGAYTGAQQARRGLFAEADGATLFLDEIGDTPPSIQPMLLRVLESGEYRPLGGHTVEHSSARLIAATDQDLAARSFNQPLLRRLEGFVIRVPPLRERREDIGLLIVHFLHQWQQQAMRELTLPSPLVSEMCNYDWPGNIRQLAHVLRRAAVALSVDELPSFAALVGAPVPPPAQALAPPPAAGRPARQRKNLSALTPRDVLDAMERHGWQILGAAAALGISRPSLYKLLQGHPQIRPAHTIPTAELVATLRQHSGDLAQCASSLRTPSEALRRHLRVSGLLE